MSLDNVNSRNEFLLELSKDPLLTSTRTPMGLLYKDHLQRFDEYLSLPKLKGSLYQTLESIPRPKHNLSSTLSYLVIVRLHLVKASEQAYDPLRVYSILVQAISLTDLSNDKVADKEAWGFLVGTMAGFLSGGLYLMSRPLAREIILLSALYSLGKSLWG